jgi:hypothetical protein
MQLLANAEPLPAYAGKRSQRLSRRRPASAAPFGWQVDAAVRRVASPCRPGAQLPLVSFFFGALIGLYLAIRFEEA